MNVFEKEFDVILDKAKSLSKPMRVVVAGADAEHLLQAVFEAEARGFAIPVLVGNEDRIRTMLKELKLEDRKYEICGVVADDNVVQDAIDVVRNGGGDVLMRGNTSTRGFLMPLLNKGNKLIKNDVLVGGIDGLDHLGVAQHLQNVGALVDGVVPDEGQLGGVAQVERAAQLPAQVAGGGLQALEHLLHVALIQHADIDLAELQVGGGVDGGDGDHAGHPGILHAADQGRHLALDLFVDPSDSIASHIESPFQVGFKLKGDGHAALAHQTVFHGEVEELVQGVQVEVGQRAPEVDRLGLLIHAHPQIP